MIVILGLVDGAVSRDRTVRFACQACGLRENKRRETYGFTECIMLNNVNERHTGMRTETVSYKALPLL